MRVISIVNNKGGVGKTTVATWLSQGLALLGKKVLVIDNDKQHNATTVFSGGTDSKYTKTIRDIYQLQDLKDINTLLTEVVQPSEVENLFYIPSTAMLSHLDIIDTDIWSNVLSVSSIKNLFDVVIFDNPPGSDVLQASTLLGCDTIVIPTELKTKATQGLLELYKWLTTSMGFTLDQIRIIPNGYKKWSKYEGFLNVIQQEFASSLTTAIPFDEVFDELDAANKIIFFSRLRAKVTPYIIKVLKELFPELPSYETIEINLYKKQSVFRSQQAKKRFNKMRLNNGKTKN